MMTKLKTMICKMYFLVISIHVLANSFSLVNYALANNALYSSVSSSPYSKCHKQEKDCFHGKLCEYIIPEDDFHCKVTTYVVETDDRSLPQWLWFNEEKRTFVGIPSEKDEGVCKILIVGLEKLQNNPTGHICGSLTLKITVWGLRHFPLFTQHSGLDSKTFHANSGKQSNTCSFNEPIILASLVFSVNYYGLTKTERERFIKVLSAVYGASVQDTFLLANIARNPFLNLLQSSHVVASGPGANRSSGGPSTLLSWHVKCGVIHMDDPLFEHLKQLSHKWALDKNISYAVIGWHVVTGFSKYYFKHGLLRRKRNVFGGSTTPAYSSTPVTQATVITRIKLNRTTYISPTAIFTRSHPSFSSYFATSPALTLHSSSSDELDRINSTSNQYSAISISSAISRSKSLSITTELSSSKPRTLIQPTSTHIRHSSTYALQPASKSFFPSSGYRTESKAVWSSSTFYSVLTRVSSFFSSYHKSYTSSLGSHFVSSNTTRLAVKTFSSSAVIPSIRISSKGSSQNLLTISSLVIYCSTKLSDFTKIYSLSPTSSTSNVSGPLTITSQNSFSNTIGSVTGTIRTSFAKTLNQSSYESSVWFARSPSFTPTNMRLTSIQSLTLTPSYSIHSVDLSSTVSANRTFQMTLPLSTITPNIDQSTIVPSPSQSMQDLNATSGSKTSVILSISEIQETVTRLSRNYATKFSSMSTVAESLSKQGWTVTGVQPVSSSFSFETSGAEDKFTISKSSLPISQKTLHSRREISSSVNIVSRISKEISATYVSPIRPSTTGFYLTGTTKESLTSSVGINQSTSLTSVETSLKSVQPTSHLFSKSTSVAQVSSTGLPTLSVTGGSLKTSSTNESLTPTTYEDQSLSRSTVSRINMSTPLYSLSSPSSLMNVITPTLLTSNSVLLTRNISLSYFTKEPSPTLLATATSVLTSSGSSQAIASISVHSTVVSSFSLSFRAVSSLANSTTRLRSSSDLTLRLLSSSVWTSVLLTRNISLSYFTKEPSPTLLATATSILTSPGSSQATASISVHSTVVSSSSLSFRAVSSLANSTTRLRSSSDLTLRLLSSSVWTSVLLTRNISLSHFTKEPSPTLLATATSVQTSPGSLPATASTSVYYTVVSSSSLSFRAVSSLVNSTPRLPSSSDVTLRLLSSSVHCVVLTTSTPLSSSLQSFRIPTSVFPDTISSSSFVPVSSPLSPSGSISSVVWASQPTPSSLAQSVMVPTSSSSFYTINVSTPLTPFISVQSAFISSTLSLLSSPWSVIVAGSPTQTNSVQSASVTSRSVQSTSVTSNVVESAFVSSPSGSLHLTTMGVSTQSGLFQSLLISNASSSIHFAFVSSSTSSLLSVIASNLSTQSTYGQSVSISTSSISLQSRLVSPTSSLVQSALVLTPSSSLQFFISSNLSTQSIYGQSAFISTPLSILVPSAFVSDSFITLHSAFVSATSRLDQSFPFSTVSSPDYSAFASSPRGTPRASIASTSSAQFISGQSAFILTTSSSVASAIVSATVSSIRSAFFSCPFNSPKSVIVSSSSTQSSSGKSVVTSFTPTSVQSASISNPYSSLQSFIASGLSTESRSVHSVFVLTTFSSIQSISVSTTSSSLQSVMDSISSTWSSFVQSVLISSTLSLVHSAFASILPNSLESVISIRPSTPFSSVESVVVPTVSKSVVFASSSQSTQTVTVSPSFRSVQTAAASSPSSLSGHQSLGNITSGLTSVDSYSAASSSSLGEQTSSIFPVVSTRHVSYYQSVSIRTSSIPLLSLSVITSPLQLSTLAKPTVTYRDISHLSVQPAPSSLPYFSVSAYTTSNHPPVAATTDVTKVQTPSSVFPPDMTSLHSSLSSVVLKSSSIAPVPTTPSNDSPKLYNSFDLLSVTVGKVFRVQIPFDTFYDLEDGNTRNLILTCLQSNHEPLSQSSWLQFNSATQTLYGIALRSQTEQIKESSDYILVAKDREGNTAYDAFTIALREDDETLAVTFSIRIVGTRLTSFSEDLSNVLFLVTKIGDYYGDKDDAMVRVSSVKDGSVLFTWGNSTIQTCDQNVINELTSRIMTKQGHIQPAFYNALSPQFVVEDVYRNETGPCISTIATEVPASSYGSSHETSLWLKYVLPALVVVFLILCFAATCFLVRRHTLVKVLGRDKKTFGRRKPIILDDELDISTLPGKPIELPDDSLTPIRYPKETSFTKPDYDNEDLSAWVSPISPAPSYHRPLPSYGGGSDNRGHSTPPPPYKLPPSY